MRMLLVNGKGSNEAEELADILLGMTLKEMELLVKDFNICMPHWIFKEG